MIKFLALSIFFMTSAFSTELLWQKDLATALKVAKKEHKNLMVMVESKHCRWCKKMKNETLVDNQVIKRLQHYILLKVSRDDKEAVGKLPEVEHVPTVLFLTQGLEVIESVVGYFVIGDFLSYIDDVEKKYPLKK